MKIMMEFPKVKDPEAPGAMPEAERKQASLGQAFSPLHMSSSSSVFFRIVLNVKLVLV